MLWSRQIWNDGRLDGQTHACTHIHQSVVVATMSCLPQAGSIKSILNGLSTVNQLMRATTISRNIAADK